LFSSAAIRIFIFAQVDASPGSRRRDAIGIDHADAIRFRRGRMLHESPAPAVPCGRIATAEPSPHPRCRKAPTEVRYSRLYNKRTSSPKLVLF
jgi:hypothetical protein